MKRRILLADDHRILRDGLRRLLEERADLEVVGEAEDGRQCVEAARELKPDMVIIDVAMPGMNGIEATRRILHDRPSTRVLALSMHSDRRYVTRILQAGASGYLLKDAAFDELSRAIDTLLEGRVYLSPDVAGVVVHDYLGKLDTASSGEVVLSPREREVLQLLAEGRATKEIASDLDVSVKTVETHRKNIMDKLGLRSIAELTKYAVREGLTPLDE
jgi:DNA-binding NarL/FixJ family response regulator